MHKKLYSRISGTTSKRFCFRGDFGISYEITLSSPDGYVSGRVYSKFRCGCPENKSLSKKTPCFSLFGDILADFIHFGTIFVHCSVILICNIKK
jgi:hypothetical protein